MDSYHLLKLLHVLSAVVVAGTGAGIAFFMFMASKSNNSEAIYVTTKHVILGDWLFTTPAILMIFATGLLLMSHLGYSFHSEWFYLVIGLFVFIGLCWLPVLRIQYQLREAAAVSVERGEISSEFRRLMRVWILLGVPAFLAILVIFWLMVYKPLPVT